MTYEVWYRAGHSLHWWKLDAMTYAHDAEVAAKAIEAALKQVGFPFAQAEVRQVGAYAEGVVPASDMMIHGEHFPEQEQVVLPSVETAQTSTRCVYCHEFLRSDERWSMRADGMFAHVGCEYPAARDAIQQWSTDVMSAIDPFAE